MMDGEVCFGDHCTKIPVYIADKIIIYPQGMQPMEGAPNIRILVCLGHKNDPAIDGALVEASVQSALKQAPFLEFTREKGEVYWRML